MEVPEEADCQHEAKVQDVNHLPAWMSCKRDDRSGKADSV